MVNNQKDFEAYKNYCDLNNISPCKASSLEKYYANNN